ncbi:MAG: hypothetical protein IT463_05105 [Planctomycetes bacterium]|nr:hypothetical protein [Planctomycetota bacterium]
MFTALAAGDSGLSRRGMTALLKLRRRQLETKDRARGALVRIEPRATPPLLDLGAVAAASPLTADFHSLLVLQLLADYPERGEPLRAQLHARRDGLDLPALAQSLWSPDGREALERACAPFGLDPALLAGTLWVALKPLFEGVARACLRFFELPQGTRQCPLCGGPPWARCNGELRCAVCETRWECESSARPLQPDDGLQPRGVQRLCDPQTGERLFDVEPGLFEAAYDTGPMIELLRMLG